MNTLSFCSSDKGDALVLGHLDIIAQRIHAVLSPRALVLIGSYGRGEGVVAEQNGQLGPVNDYDIVVVTPSAIPFVSRQALKKLRGTIAKELGIWHVDLILMQNSELHAPSVEMLRYDMKFGAVVFSGEKDILSEIPYLLSTPIPTSEILNLLVNRMVTLLEGYPAGLVDLDVRSKARQLAKVCYALTDSVLVRENAYTTQYARKREFIRNYSANSALAEFLKSNLAWMDAAWRLELQQQELHEERLLSLWHKAQELLCKEISHHTEELVSTQELTSHTAVLENWRGGKRRAPLIQTPLRLLLGKKEKYHVEQQIFSLLSQMKPNSKSADHCAKAKVLVEQWYSAV
jgi:hypothetical protein